MPDPLGRACLMPALPQRCITVVDVAILRPGSDSVDPRWLMRFINSPAIRETIELLSTGTTRRRISRGNLAQIELPVPPLNEQKRIAAKLDVLLQRVDACRAHLERVLLLLKRFRQAVLAAATSGELTEDWRERQRNKGHWRKCSLADCFDIFSGFAFKKSQYSSNGSRLLQIANVGYGHTLWEEQNFIPDDIAETIYQNFKLRVGDVVIALNRPITNGLLKVAKVKKEDLPATLYQRVACLRLKAAVDERFVFYSLRTPEFMRQVESNLQGSDQPYINTSSLSLLEINFPSLEEQREIAHRVETLFAYADRLEARYQAAREQVERLTPALLAKAFRGELVPQDPNDEPAAVLLERVKAARGSEEAKPRQRAAKPVTAPIEAEAAATTDNSTLFDEACVALFGIFSDLRSSPLRKVEYDPANGHRPAPPDIEVYDRETLLGVIREVFAGGARLDADAAIRAIARRLGYARAGARIQVRLKNTLRVAVQRGILVNGQGEYRLDRGSIGDYSQDECVAALLSAMSRGWTEREDAIRAAARHLGFRRIGSTIQDAFKSAINGAIRRGLLEYDGEMIRKIG
ncbi:MAG: restriction endonuclease subunit S [Blastocatellales bacterium]